MACGKFRQHVKWFRYMPNHTKTRVITFHAKTRLPSPKTKRSTQAVERSQPTTCQSKFCTTMFLFPTKLLQSYKLHSPCVRPGPCLQKPWQNRGTNLKPRRRLQSKHACCATATRLVRKRVARFCGLRSSRPCPKQNKLRESEKTNIKGNSTETHIAHNKPHNFCGSVRVNFWKRQRITWQTIVTRQAFTRSVCVVHQHTSEAQIQHITLVKVLLVYTSQMKATGNRFLSVLHACEVW